MSRLIIDSLETIGQTVAQFINQMGDQKIVAFYGGMGAGKTTFISELCKQLGVEDQVTSPTFAIINQYSTKNGENIYHFDFYRIKSIEEAFDFGYEEYFYGGNLCLIEWPELVESILPDHYLKVEIEVQENGQRALTLKNI